MMNFTLSRFEFRTAKAADRRSFTMIELLAVLAIFSILLAMVGAAVLSAETYARKMRTQDMVNRLSSLIMTKWNAMETRRVPIYIDPSSPAGAAKSRLDALHELMRLEMPDRLNDIRDNPITKYPDPASWDSATAKYTGTLTMTRPAVSSAYLNKVNNAPNASTFYQGAECLYMIITLAKEEGAGREFFKDSDVGDVDGDGLPEFLDGWGNPIRFLRWAPAFVPANGADSQLQTSDVDASGNYKAADPFDPLRIYGGYALYPLIYSAGPDGISDIQSDYLVPNFSNLNGLQYSKMNNNPFYKDSTTDLKLLIGLPVDVDEGTISKNGSNDWNDNIHNHFNVLD